MSDYWLKREEEALKHYITDEKEYSKHIEKIYRNMMDVCQKEIEAFYGKYAASEGISLSEAKKRVSSLDVEVFSRKAKKYVEEKNFSKQANKELKLYNATMKINRLEMLKANIGLELISGFDELDDYIGQILKGRALEEMERQAGILGESISNNAKLADSIVNSSFHNATFSDRLWQYQSVMRSDLSKLIESGLIQGKSARTLAREIRKYYIGSGRLKNGRNGAIYSAERLMRTELARVQIEAQKKSFEANGFDEYIFLANSTCCSVCRNMHNRYFKVKKMMPGVNAPPMHPNCRCSTAAYENSGKELAASIAKRNTGTQVYYSEKFDYSINLKGYSKDTLKGFSECARDVAKRGSEDRHEHMYLVDIKNGKPVYYEKGEENEVGGDGFWKFIDEHKNESFAFIHNHNTDGSFSETDMRTLLTNKNINTMIAVRNDAVMYVAESDDVLEEYFYDDMYQNDLKTLNEDVRNGKISYAERSIKREEIIVDCLLRDYTKAGEMIEIDGRK